MSVLTTPEAPRADVASTLCKLAAGVLVCAAAVLVGTAAAGAAPPASLARRVAQSTSVASFAGPAWTPNDAVDRTVASPPDGGAPTIRAVFRVGSQSANLTWATPLDLRGDHLTLDVLVTQAMTDGAFAPTLRLVAGGRVVLEQRRAIRTGGWTTLSYDLVGVSPAMLLRGAAVELSVADRVNPGSLTVWLRDLRVFASPPLAPLETTDIMVAGVYAAGADRDAEDASLLALGDPNVHVARSSLDAGGQDADILRWQRSGTPYCVTAASSDFVKFSGRPLYATTTAIAAAAADPAARGVYLHEVVAWPASQRRWDWQQALATLNWQRLDAYARIASAAGLQVVWSEPADGWRALSSNPTAMRHRRSWGRALVPAYATNFEAAASGYHLPAARAGATSAAAALGVRLGESHQSWRFLDDNGPMTAENTRALADWGRDGGASLFQFEGTTADFGAEAPYRIGLETFVCSLPRETACPAAPRPAPAP